MIAIAVDTSCKKLRDLGRRFVLLSQVITPVPNVENEKHQREAESGEHINFLGAKLEVSANDALVTGCKIDIDDTSNLE